MKRRRLKFKLLALGLFVLFGLLAVYGTYSVMTYGTRWFSSRWNPRVTSQKNNVTAGSILDRNGVILAETRDGVRTYQSDVASRSAVVHLLGDSEGMVANGVEAFQTSYLYGFQTSLPELVTGLISGSSRQGDRLTLTVDSALCTAITRSFASHEASSGKNGAAVVMNWRTGEVLALVSLPVFDPISITDSVRQDARQPFWNRAVQAVYTPGSSFKVITAAAALENLPGVASETLSCTGHLDADGQGHLVTDWAGSSHGSLSLESAFAQSCNNVFASLALRMGDGTLRSTAEGFGFNDNFLFRDLVVENSTYPTASGRSAFDVAWSGAGQSTITATPLHMCMTAAAIANGGRMMEPRLLLSVDSATGHNRLRYTSSVYRVAVSEDTAAVLQRYMRAVVTSGTGTAANLPGLTICGKTGSAETSAEGRYSTNGWFIGYCADESLPLAVCVLVEDIRDGLGGGSAAAPIAADIFRYAAANPGLVTGRVDESASDLNPATFWEQGLLLLEQAEQGLESLTRPTPVPTEVPTATPTAPATASPVPAPTTFVDTLVEGAQGAVQDAVGTIVQDVVNGVINGK